MRRMRIYLSSTDTFRHSPLYEVLVFAARRYGLSGATVIKGTMGFGTSSVVHSLKFWEVNDKLPMIVELVDEETRILKFMENIKPWLEKVRYGSLVTIEKVDVVFMKTGTKKSN